MNSSLLPDSATTMLQSYGHRIYGSNFLSIFVPLPETQNRLRPVRLAAPYLVQTRCGRLPQQTDMQTERCVNLVFHQRALNVLRQSSRRVRRAEGGRAHATNNRSRGRPSARRATAYVTSAEEMQQQHDSDELSSIVCCDSRHNFFSASLPWCSQSSSWREGTPQ